MRVKKTHAALLGGLALLLVAAVVGNTAWNSLILPSVGSVETLPLLLVLGFGLVAGIVSFFAPCGLALLPAFLSYNLAAVNEEGVKQEGIRHPLMIGVFGAAGIASFFVVLGTLFSVIGSSVNQFIQPVQYLIAVLFIVFGGMLFKDIKLVSSWFEGVRENVHETAQEQTGYRGFYVFGFAYGLDAIGCLFPLVFALMLIPIISGSLVLGVGSFLAYSVGLAIMFTLFAYGTARGKDVMRITENTQTIRKLAGSGLILGGVALLAYYTLWGMPIAA